MVGIVTYNSGVASREWKNMWIGIGRDNFVIYLNLVFLKLYNKSSADKTTSSTALIPYILTFLFS